MSKENEAGEVAKVIVCGADWCGDTRATLAQLNELQIPYAYVDVDQDPEAAEWVRGQNDGKQKLPTVDVDGLILSVPDEAQLISALEQRGLIIDSA